ncbi:hypothetical protein F4811DRAFT_543115 [Daldinia bambusicola]|nr:hypothetical protein F4811DRAFT_543115 [Daldinia bambusicola]
MSPSHRPDLALYRNPVPVEKADLAPFMWPSINLEDLCKPDPVLLMIHSRGNFLPAHFAYHDFKSIRLGYSTSYFTTVSLPGYSLSFEGVAAAEYGQLYNNTKDHSEFKDHAARGFYDPNVGFRVLVVQDRIYCFLVRVCEEILHDISTQVLLNGDLPSLDVPMGLPPRASLPTLRFFFGIDKFAGLYKSRLHTPFARTESIIRSMLFAAEGHFKALREDPDYFRTILIETDEHCCGRLLDVSGRVCPSYVMFQDIYWARTIRQIISGAFSIVGALEATYKGFCFLNSSVNDWIADPSRTATLPLRIYKWLYGLYYSMTRVGQNIICSLDLLESIRSSPPLREYFYYTYHDPSVHDPSVHDPDDPDNFQIKRRPRVSMTKDCADVVYFLENIASEAEAGPLSSEEFLTELDVLIRRNPRAKSFISGWVSTYMSILGLVCECLNALDEYQPWILGRIQYRKEYPGEVEDFYETEFADSFNVHNIPDSFWMSTVPTIRKLLKYEWNYPAHEPCSEKVARKLLRTQEALDQFWDKVVAQLEIVGASKGCICRVFRRDPQRATDRTKRKKTDEGDVTEPELKRPKTQAKAQIRGKVKAGAKPDPKAKVMEKNERINGLSDGTVACQVNVDSKGVVDVDSKDVMDVDSKEATDVDSKEVMDVDSKEVISRTEEADTETKGPQAEDEAPLLKVDSRTFEVFMTLLSDGTDPSSRAEIFWDDIVHAMETIGFTAVNLFFSAWFFYRSNPDSLWDCVMLSEPHSAKKLDSVMITYFGRHIFWTFGWKCSMFARAL